MTNRFAELRNDAYQSSQVIEAQLQSVESSLLGASVAVLISVLISRAFGLLIFWIPASFLLMWLLLIYPILNSLIKLLRRLLRRRNRKERNGIAQTAGLLSDENTFFLITTGFKNAAPVFKTIGVVFLISFLSLLIYRIGLIGWFISFPITIPLVSSLLFLPLPFLISTVIAELEKRECRLDFANIGCRALCLIVVGAFIYVLALLVFPIWSFVVLSPIYTGGLPHTLSLVVVMILLMITALAFINYFSASQVRKEMGIALFHLSNIQNRIEDLLSNQRSISDKAYQELLEEYAKAKRYNMAVDDTLLVNYYSIKANPTYLSGLDKQR